MKYENNDKNILINANEINIGDSVSFGNNINIKLKGKFQIGDHSRLGDNANIMGNNVVFGKYLFNSSGLRIGGGGRQHPDANLTMGDRCTIHNNFINVCEPVVIGDDVGLSPETSILSHGYWQSVLEGYPALFSGVNIGNGVIVGYRSLIMMGVSIADNAVIGANSVVTKNIDKKGIYAGSPARFIKDIHPLNREQRIEKIEEIVKKYLIIANYHDLTPEINIEYPFVMINGFKIDVETFEYSGKESIESDDFRDYVRKWGIRIYTPRGFRSNFSIE